MRIALVHTGGTLWLAGDPALTEREHPSAGNLRINGKTATQVDEIVRGAEAVHTDRGNLATSVTFETSRIFATPALAEVWSGLYDAANARAGTLVGVGVSSGLDVMLNFAGCVVQPPRREVIGCTVLLSYEVLAGAPTQAFATAEITGTLSPTVTTPLLQAANYNGKVAYSHDGTAIATALTDDPYTVLYWSGSIWVLKQKPAGVAAKSWESWSSAATPDLIPPGAWSMGNTQAWVPVNPATGTPVVTLGSIGVVP